MFKAPLVADPRNVLDIGTGTGIWAKQFARRHPGSTVIGTDLSLIQTQDNLPPNVTFVREDSEELWVFDHAFDYIHWRASMYIRAAAMDTGHVLQKLIS